MKNFYSILIFAFVVNLFCTAQTVLPYEKELIEQYNFNLAPTSSYSSLKLLLDNNKENVFAFLSGSGNFTYGGQTVVANGSASFLLQFKTSTGEMVWSTSMGNAATPLNFIEYAIKDPNGNICISARGNFQAGVPVTMGTQTFAFRTDMIPNVVFATFNPTTRVWSKVKFLYIANNQGFTASPMFDKTGNFYICGTVNSSALYVDNTLVASVGTIPSTIIYVYKENSQGTVVYQKQSTTIDARTYISNFIFEVDNAENLYITGDISYIYGAISMDGVIVKNDTLSNAYDYSYDDIFLYKINPSGTVQFGKTYLNRGNEAPRFLHALSNGSLYLSGEYSGQMNDFPPNSGSMNYNRFIANISASNGAFNWAFPIISDVYYQDRFPFTTLVDEAEDLYFSVNFCPNSFNFMGQTYQKRNNKYGTSNTLVAKVSSAGVLQWGNVLGPVTTFETSYIDNPRVNFGMVGSKNLVLQVSSLSSGTNKNFEWGSGPIPTTTISSGMWGTMAVVDRKTGDIANGYYQKFTETIEIDSVSFFALRNNDSWTWDLARFKPQSPNGIITPKVADNEMIIYPNPVKDELFIKNLPTSNNALYIYSLEGKMVLKLTIQIEKVSVKDLPNGVYTIKVGDKNSRFVKIK